MFFRYFGRPRHNNIILILKIIIYDYNKQMQLKICEYRDINVSHYTTYKLMSID